MIKIPKLNQAGDTIVEVLISMIVLGTVLAGAYATASRSQNTIRATQERAEALKIVEGQMEQLRNTGLDNTSSFCFTASGEVSASVPCALGPEGRYRVQINSNGERTYHVIATWDRIGGGSEQRIDMFYRGTEPNEP